MGLRTWTASQLAEAGDHCVDLTPDLAARLRETTEAADLRGDRDLHAAVTAIERGLGPDGPGLVVTRGAGLADCTDEQLTRLLLAVSAELGELTPQNAEGEEVVVVHDTRPPDVETARGYLSNSTMRLHTDPTDLAALMCLHASNRGGGNSFVSAGAVLDALSDEAPDLVHEYFRLWQWDLCGLQRPDVDPLVATPVFSHYGGELSCRYGSRMLREGASRRTGRLEPAEQRLLELFEAVAHRPELTWRHRLERGEIVWMDNYRVLHGRDAFVDDDIGGQMRTLLRVWLWRRESPPLAPAFRPFAGAIDRRPV